MSALNHISNSVLNTRYTTEESELNLFLKEWDEEYEKESQNIAIFNPSLTQHWTEGQKVFFAKAFYHARGHFHDFLWYLGNHAESKSVKDMILKNISEEMNGSARSHEQLYIDFAESVGADLEKEFVEEETYLDSIKEFNKGHLRWLQNNDNNSRLSAFSAYERLDNIDYKALMALAKSINVSQKGQLFFKIHTRVQHFESTEGELKMIWKYFPQKVRDSFRFIHDHQIEMWKNISNSVFQLS